jgi:hypothetical protein
VPSSASGTTTSAETVSATNGGSDRALQEEHGALQAQMENSFLKGAAQLDHPEDAYGLRHLRGMSSPMPATILSQGHAAL